MTSEGYVGDGSPDRADALVWGLTELMGGSHQEIPIVPPFNISNGMHWAKAFDFGGSTGRPGGEVNPENLRRRGLLP
jgi:hypothetical protein